MKQMIIVVPFIFLGCIIVALIIIILYLCMDKENFYNIPSFPGRSLPSIFDTSLTTECTTDCPQCGDIPDWKTTWINSRTNLGDQVFKKYDVSQGWVNSQTYNINDFNTALFDMMDGIGEFKFYQSSKSAASTLINIAAFLSQCMAETIIYDACDENNWTNTTTDTQPYQYPFSAACGQGMSNYVGPNYQCDEGCTIDPQMTIVAQTNANWYGAPPPLFCAPKSKISNTGYWKTSGNWCSPDEQQKDPLKRPDEYIKNMSEYTPSCHYYKGQKDGKPMSVDGGAPNNQKKEDQRRDVEGCCWWGRGIIQLTGPCNIGKLDRILKGTKYLKDGESLCTNPALLCSSSHPLLKYIAGMVYWCTSVQNYDKDGYNYIQDLENFSTLFEKNPQQTIDTMSFTEGQFIYSVSGIVNRGCPTPGKSCEPFSIDESRRMCFFKIILSILFNVSKPVILDTCPHP